MYVTCSSPAVAQPWSSAWSPLVRRGEVKPTFIRRRFDVMRTLGPNYFLLSKSPMSRPVISFFFLFFVMFDFYTSAFSPVICFHLIAYLPVSYSLSKLIGSPFQTHISPRSASNTKRWRRERTIRAFLTLLSLNSTHIIIVRLLLLTMTNLNHMQEMLLFVCSNMAD